MKSKYELGWIAVRASRVGKSTALLKRNGFMRLNHSDLNNRLGANFVKPFCTCEQFEQWDWRRASRLGLEGIAFWITDAQWGLGVGPTDKQWQGRAMIELAFNAKWPTGKRGNNKTKG